DSVRKSGVGDEGEEFGSKRVVACFHGARGELDLQIVTFGKGGGTVAVRPFLDDMIGGRGGVGEHHGRLAIGKETVGLAPARSDGQDLVLKLRPGVRRLIAVDGFHPEEKAKAGRGSARVLNDDLEIASGLHQLLEARWRRLDGFAVVDKGKIAVVVR